MGDNIQLEDRNGLRTPMQWNKSSNAGFSNAPVDKLWAPVISSEIFGFEKVNVESQLKDPQSLFNRIRHMISIRKSFKAFGQGDFEWVDLGHHSVAAYYRSHPGERFLVINNLSNEKLNLLLPRNQGGYMNVLDNQVQNNSDFILNPYQYMWLLAKL